MKQKTALSWQFFKYTLWLGPILMIMGLSAGFVSGTWEPIPLGLIIAGVVIIGLWLLFRAYFRQGDSLKHPYWSRRSTQAGTNAFAATVSVFVIIGLINFLAVRHAVRLDLTENQQFTLAPQTQTLLTTLEQPVRVVIFDRSQNPQTRELLARYRRIAPEKFSYELIDPQMQPGVAQEFGVSRFGEVFLESGSRRQLLRQENLGVLNEVNLTNGIEQLISNRRAKVYFLEGHGQRPLTEGQGGLQTAVDALSERNFLIESLSLTQQSSIPDDADVIVIAGPQRPLFRGEVEAIDNYLDQGGSVFLMIDPNTNPGLNLLLEKWGVRVDDRIAIDATGSGRLVGLGPTVPIVREYGEHPITQAFNNGISFFPLARPVETRPVEGITESPLIWTEPESWAETNVASRQFEFDPESDRKGPLSLGVALTKSVPTPDNPAAEATEEAPEDSPSEARLVVLGNSQFATNGWFEQQLNGDVFINTITWLSQPDQANLSIRPRPVTNRRLMITPILGRSLSWVAIVILPLLGFVTAGILWWRRR